MATILKRILSFHKICRRKNYNFPLIRKISAESTVVVVDGYRSPFAKYQTSYRDSNILDFAHSFLSAAAIKCPFEKGDFDYCIIGHAIQNVLYPNISQEIVAKVDEVYGTPAHTINAACLSSLFAATSAHDLISTKAYRSVLTGGIEFMSDLPIRLPKSLRRGLIHLYAINRFKFFSEIIDEFPWITNYEVPQFKDFCTKKSMIDECEIMCLKNDIMREEADEYAILSHSRAFFAREQGLNSDIIPIYDTNDSLISQDTIIRTSNMNQLRKLRPVSSLSKPDKFYSHRNRGECPISGVLTSGNSTCLTDGMSVTLLSSEKNALFQGSKPKAYFRGYTITGHDPAFEPLMGPAYAIPKLLKKFNLRFEDIGIFEIHEAFAGQILCLIKCINDRDFLRKSHDITDGLGTITVKDINKWGGSLSLGHPLGATGSRLINMASNQLQNSNHRYALVSACSTGGQAVAILLERYGSP